MEDTLQGGHLQLLVSGQINVGDSTQKPELKRKNPQGMSLSQLLLETNPVTDRMPENFVPVEYREAVEDRSRYSSVLVINEESGNIISDIKKIDQRYS